MASVLPIEVAERAIDFLHDDIRALTACALASRALLHAARFHIWREIAVPVQAHPTHVRMQSLMEILDANADIPPLIVSLTLRGVLSPQPRNRIQQRWDDATGTMRLWEKLPHLQVLRFIFLKFNLGLHQLLPIAYSLPNLEEVAVIGSHAMLSRDCPTRPSYRDSVVALDTPPQLKRLSVAGGSISWSFLDGLARLLLEPGMHAPLEALDLSCIARSSNFKYATWDSTDTLPSHAWAPVIASLGPTLRHCTLGLLAAECSPENLANLYGSITQCARLRSLSIQCNAMTYSAEATSPRPFVFVDMLADALSSTSLHPPFPELETLSIGWLWAPGPIPPGCADACKRLACALKDRAGCPLLKRLNVVVNTVRRMSNEVPTEQREEMAARAEPILRSCFERAVLAGVQLEVDLSEV